MHDNDNRYHACVIVLLEIMIVNIIIILMIIFRSVYDYRGDWPSFKQVKALKFINLFQSFSYLNV